MYEPGHAIRTDRSTVGFKIGELDGEETARAHELAELMNAVAETHITTNLFGDRWSKLAVNSMANAIAGLSGYGSNEVRTLPLPRGIAIQLAAEVVAVGRAAGHEIEPLMGIPAQHFVDAAEGRNVEPTRRGDGSRSAGPGRGTPVAPPGRDARSAYRDRGAERLRRRRGEAPRRAHADQRGRGPRGQAPRRRDADRRTPRTWSRWRRCCPRRPPPAALHLTTHRGEV